MEAGFTPVEQKQMELLVERWVGGGNEPGGEGAELVTTHNNKQNKSIIP